MNLSKTTLLIALSLLLSGTGYSFCGFYVAKADAKLFNKASQVILVRDGKSTTVTMSNDFEGNVKDFAMVVPVPVILKREDIKTVSPAVFDKLDGYSGPRLVEYHDQNPCEQLVYQQRKFRRMAAFGGGGVMSQPEFEDNAREYKVKIEAEYKVDEYDILILSAEESEGLKRWLTDNDYKIPEKAEKVLEPYIKNNLKFFVVKVDKERLALKNTKTLNPIQIKYNSDKFQLPIRLGMANSKGEQDMVVYGLTPEGRVECTNYRTVEIPTNRNIPTFVRDDFGAFYKDVFDREYGHQGENAVFLEYAWDVTPSWAGVKCDPCTGPPPINQDLVTAGVSWDMRSKKVYFTRLHVRYSEDKFAQDLQFQVTPNTQNFQGRYIITNPASGPFDCDEGQSYLADLVNRRQRELDELQVLAGWNPEDRPLYVEGYRELIEDEATRNDIITPTLPPGNGILPKLIFSAIILLSVILFLSNALGRLFRRNIPSV